jgi:single-strand DNA-binding protein|tara:strand:+ start:4553 stop:4984 length:432 start_codon:yes stop_codon:yes gene_type:complete
MSDINKVIITGRVTRDSELRQTPNGTPVTDVSVVSNRIWNKNGERQEEATFVDVTVWGKQAETLSPMLTKGRHIMVEGRMKLNSWETEEGVKRSKLTVVAESINLTPNNPNPKGNQDSSLSREPVAAGAPTAAASATEEETPF